MQKHLPKALKEQKMAGKTTRFSWEEWQKYCAEHGLDPHKTCEDSVDLGGGDSCEVVCVDVPIRED